MITHCVDCAVLDKHWWKDFQNCHQEIVAKREWEKRQKVTTSSTSSFLGFIESCPAAAFSRTVTFLIFHLLYLMNPSLTCPLTISSSATVQSEHSGCDVYVPVKQFWMVIKKVQFSII